MAHIILVHGASQSGSCWESVPIRLSDCGHTVEVLDLPGHGQDSTPLAEVTLAKYAQKVAQAILSSPEPPVVIGHSMGGFVITAGVDLALEAAGSVNQLIYVTALVPGDGESMDDLRAYPEFGKGTPPGTVEIRGVPPVLYILNDENRLGGQGGYIPTFEPQPLAPFSEPVRLKHSESYRRSYVFATRDQVLPLAAQERFVAQRLMHAVARIDSDHAPFVTHPAELVAIIDAWSRQ
mgnify:CR=1 FL=1